MHNKYNIKDITELLSENNVKPTHQRLVVLKYLIEKKNHPSVEQIYKDLVEDIPTLSKTTVYNTLKLLSDKNVVTALNINTEEILYDYIVKPHAHFRCNKCGAIFDVDVDENLLNKSNINGHLIFDAQINYSGKCSNCK